ncbi:MAG: hypothetical protein QXQ90_05830 [Desulfurococcaceae archaeon]
MQAQEVSELNRLIRELTNLHNDIALRLSYCHSKSIIPIPWGLLKQLLDQALALADEIERRYGKHPQVESIRRLLNIYKPSIENRQCMP